MIEEAFLSVIFICAIALSFVAGGVIMLLGIYLFKGKDAAIQFFKEEFLIWKS